MNFDITGGSGVGSAIILTMLIFGGLLLAGAILGGLWRTRRGAPTIDPEDDVER